jgi:hypothetical protein
MTGRCVPRRLSGKIPAVKPRTPSRRPVAAAALLMAALPLCASVPCQFSPLSVGRQLPTVNPSSFNCPGLTTCPSLTTDIYQYNCCQPSIHIDRHGVTNFFTYYGNKRLTSSPLPFDAQTSTALALSCLGAKV